MGFKAVNNRDKNCHDARPQDGENGAEAQIDFERLSRVHRRAGAHPHRQAVLGGARPSRQIWARFVAEEDLQTVKRCNIEAQEAIGGAPREMLYDRKKTAVKARIRMG